MWKTRRRWRLAAALVLVVPLGSHRSWGVIAVVLAACNGLARVYLGRTTRWMWSVGRRSA
jgi:hypothetical protein